MASKGKGKKVAPAPKAASSKKSQKKTFYTEHSHLFNKDPKNLSTGGDVRVKTDLSRFVKWPRYVRVQRQKAILKKRLKVPPALNQFIANTLDKNQAANVLKLLRGYRPESKDEKKQRRLKSAETESKGAKPDESKKPKVLKYGLNHVTSLIEEKKARLVVIAHDVDPIELVVWLPALCRRMDVPYVIIKGKSRLGHLVYKKTATAVVLTDVRKEDQTKLDQIVANAKSQFNDNANSRKTWGGGVMGIKAQAVIRSRERARQRDLVTKQKSA
jgi:large subunit ribosomal protein L7Ae